MCGSGHAHQSGLVEEGDRLMIVRTYEETEQVICLEQSVIGLVLLVVCLVTVPRLLLDQPGAVEHAAQWVGVARMSMCSGRRRAVLLN